MTTITQLLRLTVVAAFGLSSVWLHASVIQQREARALGGVRGIVVANTTQAPLRRTKVRIVREGSNADAGTVTTDRDGRFEIAGIPAGHYQVIATRSGYLTLAFGQRTPREVPGLVEIRPDKVTDIRLALPRAGVVSGTVSDDFGEPVAGAQLSAMRVTYAGGKRRLQPTGQPIFSTDDAGQFRIVGLPPGDYFVLASSRETWIEKQGAGPDVSVAFLPTYFPGVADPTRAQRITVGLSDQVVLPDFSLATGVPARVSGTAFDSNGMPAAGASIQLVQLLSASGGAVISSATTDRSGAFAMSSVPPGDYWLSSTNQSTGERGRVRVPVNADHVEVPLYLSKGWTVSGEVVMQDGAAPPPGVRIRPQPIEVDDRPAFTAAASSGAVARTGLFQLGPLGGAVFLRAVVPEGMALHSVLRDGVDITDTPMELKSGEHLRGVRVVLTSRPARLAVSLRPDDSGGATDGSVVVFPADPQKWFDGSRWVRVTRCAQAQSCVIRGLPPGDYLAVGLTDLDDGEWTDPSFLESITGLAQRVRLSEGLAASVTLSANPVRR